MFLAPAGVGSVSGGAAFCRPIASADLKVFRVRVGCSRQAAL